MQGLSGRHAEGRVGLEEFADEIFCCVGYDSYLVSRLSGEKERGSKRTLGANAVPCLGKVQLGRPCFLSNLHGVGSAIREPAPHHGKHNDPALDMSCQPFVHPPPSPSPLGAQRQTHPKLQQSTGNPYPSIVYISGALYPAEPAMTCNFCPGWISTARPKSETTQSSCPLPC